MTTPQPVNGYPNRSRRVAPSWNGSRNAAGMPVITGVSALKAAAIKNDWRNKNSLAPGRSSKQLAEQAADEESAHQEKRKTAFEMGYEKYRRSLGFGAKPDEAAPVDPVKARAKQLQQGGAQPNEAMKAAQDEANAKAAQPAPAVPAVNTPPTITPKAGATPAPLPNATPTPAPATTPGTPPVVAGTPVVPHGTMKTSDGEQSLGEWEAAKKTAQQADADKFATATDVPNIAGPPAPPAPPVIAKTDDEDKPTGMAKGGKVKGALAAAKQKMSPICRESGGPAVGGQTWEGLPPGDRQLGSQAPATIATRVVKPATYLVPPAPSVKRIARESAAPASPMAHGGKPKKGKTYKVGEKGPELFIPKKKTSPPAVIGANGPETGKFPEDGVVVPNHALHAMKKKFSKGGDDDNDAAVEPDEDEDDKTPSAMMSKAKTAMRSSVAA